VPVCQTPWASDPLGAEFLQAQVDSNVSSGVAVDTELLFQARSVLSNLDGFYGQLLSEGRRDGRGGLSHKTVRYIHGILHKAIADAQRKGSVIRNVAALADAPKLSSSKKREMRVWTAGELRDFLVAIAHERPYPAVFLAVPTPACGEAKCWACTGKTWT
jgi:hypothetical protein